MAPKATFTDVHEAALILGLPENEVYRMLRASAFPADVVYHLNRRWKFYAEPFRAWVEARQTHAAPVAVPALDAAAVAREILAALRGAELVFVDTVNGVQVPQVRKLAEIRFAVAGEVPALTLEAKGGRYGRQIRE